MPRVSKKDEAQITKILERVNRKEESLTRRYDWMDHDYENGWRLDSYKPKAGDGISQEDAYTSNFPKLLNTKGSGAIAYSEQIIRVEDSADNEEFRDQNNAYERLAIGMLANADDRLVESGKPTVIGGSAWYACVRGGWIAARAVLIKDENSKTVEDVVPIDPRSFVYEMGRGEPLWAAIVTERSKADIRDEYPKFKFNDDGQSDPEDDDDDRVRVIDYYWTERGAPTQDEDGEQIAGKKTRMNATIIDKQFAKKPTNTFSVNFPIVIRLIGLNPGVANFTLKNDNEDNKEIIGIEDVGDSLYTPLRDITPSINRLRSMQGALTHKALQGTLKVWSKDGTKELDQDAFEDGAEMQLSRDNLEDIELLNTPQLTSDAVRLEQSYLIDQTNAGFSEQRFGRMSSAVSGAALRIIGQSDNEIIAPFLNAVQSLMEGVIDNLGKQYETNRYETIKVRGKTHTGESFNQDITPEDIEGHGILSVKLRPVQPENEAERWQAALLASQVDPITGIGLMSQKSASTKIAGTQDWDYEVGLMNEQRARISSQKMILIGQWEAAKRAGKEDDAALLAIDIQREIDREDMEESARLFAFRQAVGADPLQGAAGGIDRGSSGAGGGGGVQQQSDPSTLNINPTIISNSGRAGVDQTASPDAGTNTVGNSRTSAESIGLEPNT